MSNITFDNLDARCNLKAATESLATWKAARARAALTADEIEFLDRAVAGAEGWVSQARARVKEWWT